MEFETAHDLRTAVDKLDGREFKGARVTCTADVRSILLIKNNTDCCRLNRTPRVIELALALHLAVTPMMTMIVGDHHAATLHVAMRTATDPRVETTTMI